jgi:hypothetical protein
VYLSLEGCYSRIKKIVLHDKYKGMEKKLPAGHTPTKFEVCTENASLSDDAIRTLKNSMRTFTSNIDDCAGSGDETRDHLSRMMRGMGVDVSSELAISMNNQIRDVLNAMGRNGGSG